MVSSSMAFGMAPVVRACVGLLLGVLITMAAIVVLFWIWQESQPEWCLSARNSVDGVVVEVFKGSQELPTHSTILKGRAIPRDVERLVQEELPVEIGKTIFSDETLRPGRWTLVLGGVKLDIMERAMVVEDAEQN